jgi:hypothetical protein
MMELTPPTPCEKAPKGSHCDHLAPYTLTTNPPITVYHCCWCSRERRVVPISMSLMQAEKEHGPGFRQYVYNPTAP